MIALATANRCLLAALLGGLTGCGGVVDPASEGETDATETSETETAEATETSETVPTDALPCLAPEERLQPDPDRSPTGLIECSNGIVHRQRAVACELGDWTTGACRPTENSDECEFDDDCDAAVNGFCGNNHKIHAYSSCVCAFACTTDADCGDDEACYCDGARSECIRATCRSDDDCPAESLCQLGESPRCAGTARALACTSPEDECRLDTDCEGGLECNFWMTPHVCLNLESAPCG